MMKLAHIHIKALAVVTKCVNLLKRHRDQGQVLTVQGR